MEIFVDREKKKRHVKIYRDICHLKMKLDFKGTRLNVDTRNKIQWYARESDIRYIWIIYKNHFQRHCPRCFISHTHARIWPGLDKHFSKLARTTLI